MRSGFQITNVKMIRIIVARKHDVTAVGHAGFLKDFDGFQIVGIDNCNNLGSCRQVRKGLDHCCDCFTCVALSPGLLRKTKADLGLPTLHPR